MKTVQPIGEAKRLMSQRFPKCSHASQRLFSLLDKGLTQSALRSTRENVNTETCLVRRVLEKHTEPKR